MTTVTIERAVLEQAVDVLQNCWYDESPPTNTLPTIQKLRNALAAPQPLSIDQISMIFNRVYPAQPLSQNIINLVQEVEKHHGIK